MGSHKFNPKDLAKLADPARLGIIDLRGVVRHFGLRGPAVLADVGAGLGIFSEAMLGLLPEARCHALDIVPEMADWMRANRAGCRTGRLVPGVMEEARIPLADESVDFVFLITVHHELDRPVELFRDALRALKPGGGILSADWKKGWTGAGPPQDHRVEPADAASHLERAGFPPPVFIEASDRLFCLCGRKPAKPGMSGAGRAHSGGLHDVPVLS